MFLGQTIIKTFCVLLSDTSPLCCKYSADITDLCMSGGQKEWIQIRRSLIESTLFAFDYISHICSRQHKHMPFLCEVLKCLKG